MYKRTHTHMPCRPALPSLPAGKRVVDVPPVLASAVEPFGVHLVEGVMSHQMKQFIIDGNKVRRPGWLRQRRQR